MAQQNKDQVSSNEEADFAKAFQELAKGEQTATALENHLSALEAKIEELLAQADKDQQPTTSVQSKPNGSSAAASKETKP